MSWLPLPRYARATAVEPASAPAPIHSISNTIMHQVYRLSMAIDPRARYWLLPRQLFRVSAPDAWKNWRAKLDITAAKHPSNTRGARHVCRPHPVDFDHIPLTPLPTHG